MLESNHFHADLNGHAIVVGGTGMLCAVSLWLAKSYGTVTVIGRNSRRLSSLANLSSRFNVVAADYRQRSTFKRALIKVVDGFGPPNTVVAWIHDGALDCLFDIGALFPSDDVSHLVLIRGSASAAPGLHEDPTVDAMKQLPNLCLTQVILGWKLERGIARWLTNEEIAQGVISTIEQSGPRYIVGIVEPWNLHP